MDGASSQGGRRGPQDAAERARPAGPGGAAGSGLCARLQLRISAALIAFALWVLRRTWRVRVVGRLPPGTRLFAFWHGDQIALHTAAAGRRPTVLISRSRDGSLAARVAAKLRLPVVRGSSSRGSVPAALRLVRTLTSGDDVALAVDGPRGPCGRAKPGAARLARLAGASLVAVVAAARRQLSLRSWDRMALPAPFTRVVVVCAVVRDGGDLQRRMGTIAARARRLAGGPMARRRGE